MDNCGLYAARRLGEGVRASRVKNIFAIMEKIKHESTEYARIEGVGLVVLANERMTLNQAINAKSYQVGLPTRYSRQIKGYLVTEHMKCFISICNCRRHDFKESPNRSRYLQPNCF